MEWHGIIILTKSEAVDTIASRLYEIGVKGIEIIDPSLTQEERDELIVDYIDDHLKKTDFVKIVCYFSSEENIEEKIGLIEAYLLEIKDFVDIGEGSIETLITKEEDWANNWKQYYKPFRVGDHIVIKPTWETFEDLRSDDLMIEIDPGMAFGCGTHETTSMCIELLQTYLKPAEHVIDVGCGSGILSIVAAKLGAKSVVAIDVDKAAVKVTNENIELNGISDIVTVFHGDLLQNTQVKADLVVANIMADIIILLMDDISRVLKAEGTFIASGIIQERAPEVKAKIESAGFVIIEVTQNGEWVAIAAQLKG